jgi:hypothetical protein
LTARILPADATNKAIIWSSSDTGVANVDRNGRVTAIGRGTANITVRSEDGEFADIATITVDNTEIPVDFISVSPEEANLKIGETLALEASTFPVNATQSAISWTSSDVTVANVDAFGNVTALSEGNATITASVMDGESTASVILTIESAPEPPADPAPDPGTDPDTEPTPDPNPGPSPGPDPEPIDEEEEVEAPNLLIENGSAAEGQNIEFTVSLSWESSETIVLNLGFLDDTADSADYAGQAITVTFEPGETMKVVSVPTYGDSEIEAHEMFYVGVSEVLEGTLGDYYDRAELTIMDEDAPIRIYPNPATSNTIVQLSGILSGDYQLTVYCISGELVQKQSIAVDGTYPLMLNNMAKGIYIIRAIGMGHEFNGKLIVR